MRIIGIDPGSRKTGWGLIHVVGSARKLVHVDHGVLRLDVDNDLPMRVAELAFRMSDVLRKHQPDIVVIEDVFVGEHSRSALILGQARGAVLAACGLLKIEVASLATRKVKQTLAGSGAADKSQVGQMVRVLLGLDCKIAEDASDALALAITHAHGLGVAPSSHVLPSTQKMSKKAQRSALADLARLQGKSA